MIDVAEWRPLADQYCAGRCLTPRPDIRSARTRPVFRLPLERLLTAKAHCYPMFRRVAAGAIRRPRRLLRAIRSTRAAFSSKVTVWKGATPIATAWVDAARAQDRAVREVPADSGLNPVRFSESLIARYFERGKFSDPCVQLRRLLTRFESESRVLERFQA